MYDQSPAHQKSYQVALCLLALQQTHSRNPNLRPFLLQMARSATSVIAHLEESVGAESRTDFRHKISIAYKEARETQVWLHLLRDAKYLPVTECDEPIRLSTEVVKMLFRTLQTLNDRRS